MEDTWYISEWKHCGMFSNFSCVGLKFKLLQRDREKQHKHVSVSCFLFRSLWHIANLSEVAPTATPHTNPYSVAYTIWGFVEIAAVYCVQWTLADSRALSPILRQNEPQSCKYLDFCYEKGFSCEPEEVAGVMCFWSASSDTESLWNTQLLFSQAGKGLSFFRRKWNFT